jgi:hypothetical protein
MRDLAALNAAPTDFEPFLTAREVAERLRIAPCTVLRYFEDGVLPGRRLRVRRRTSRWCRRARDGDGLDLVGSADRPQRDRQSDRNGALEDDAPGCPANGPRREADAEHVPARGGRAR